MFLALIPVRKLNLVFYLELLPVLGFQMIEDVSLYSLLVARGTLTLLFRGAYHQELPLTGLFHRSTAVMLVLLALQEPIKDRRVGKTDIFFWV